MNPVVLLLGFLSGVAGFAADRWDQELSHWSQKYEALEKELLELQAKSIELRKRLSEVEAPNRYFDASSVCEGRLTLSSGVPVTTTNVTGGTLYYTPYKGSACAFYNTTSTTWHVVAFTQVSLTLAVTANTNYDVYLYLSSGVPTLQTVAWSSATARNAGDTVALRDGVYVRNNDNSYRYVGTVRASALNTVADTATQRFVWNYQNQLMRPLIHNTEATNTWTYATNTWRQARATASNRVEIVNGLIQTPVHLFSLVPVTNGSGALNYYASGIGVDSTTTNSSSVFGAGTSNIATNQAHSEYFGYPGIGYHALNWLERGHTSTITVWGDNGDATKFQAGLLGYVLG